MTNTTSNSNPNSWIALSRNVVHFLALVGVLFLLWNVTTTKLDNLREGSDAYRQGFISAADRTQQLDCLTKNIYWEAATEPFEGKVAVAQVTMNRVESGRFGNGVCGVVYQKNVIYEKVICQFSWACMPGIKQKAVYPALYKESEEVAKKVLLENFRLPSMEKAMYYHADYVNPKWGKPKLTQIGHHIFYKD
jgi:spore germination cell wall hydrolase CwlJ-like protein